MDCFICHTDITDTVKQFGNTRRPVCASCYLVGADAMLDNNPDIVAYMERGYDVKVATKAAEEDWEEANIDLFAEFTDNGVNVEREEGDL